MARLNTPNAFTDTTHEGAPASRMNAEQALRRTVLSCLLWEDEFYEDGITIADRIARLIPTVDADKVMQLAIDARSVFNLRHVPLLMLSILAKHKRLKAYAVTSVIQRADELAELLAVHAKCNGIPVDKLKGHIPAQMKKGLAAAFLKFDEYQLAKYNRDGAIKLRDIAFLVCPKASERKQGVTFAKLVNRTFYPESTRGGFKVKKEYELGEFEGLAIPDTWEVALSGGADKRETFTRLLTEGTKNEEGKVFPLGYMALLRNLRNMVQAGVDESLIRKAIIAREGGAHRVLPFRFVAAARACPQMEPALDQALCEIISESPVMDGKTFVLVDVSQSMDAKLSAKSDMTRRDAAAILGSMINGDRRVFSFSERLVEVPPRFGMAGVDAINNSQPHSGTQLGGAIEFINRWPHDRLIVITDEQSATRVPAPIAKRAYMINVASNRNGVSYSGGWTHIDGFSESVLRYIRVFEFAGAEKNMKAMG